MRCLKRNMTKFYYARFVEEQVVTDTDEYGNALETGEYQSIYENPVACMANIAPASGNVSVELFGTSENYDKILIIADRDVPINEHSILWIDTTPEIMLYDDVEPVMEFESGGVIIGDNGQFSPHDYVVKRIAKSLNSLAIAVTKVNVA